MRIRNVVFGAGTLAALGFGAATARAEAGTLQGPICPFVQSVEECSDCCASAGFGFTFVNGYCTCR